MYHAALTRGVGMKPRCSAARCVRPSVRPCGMRTLCFKASVTGSTETATTPVTMKVGYRCMYGNDVYLVGSTDQLGNWSTAQALRMRWSEGDVWSIDLRLDLSKSSGVEYKYVVMSQDRKFCVWKPGANYKLTLPKEVHPFMKLVVCDAWDDSYKNISHEADSASLWEASQLLATPPTQQLLSVPATEDDPAQSPCRSPQRALSPQRATTTGARRDSVVATTPPLSTEALKAKLRQLDEGFMGWVEAENSKKPFAALERTMAWRDTVEMQRPDPTALDLILADRMLASAATQAAAELRQSNRLLAAASVDAPRVALPASTSASKNFTSTSVSKGYKFPQPQPGSVPSYPLDSWLGLTMPPAIPAAEAISVPHMNTKVSADLATKVPQAAATKAIQAEARDSYLSYCLVPPIDSLPTSNNPAVAAAPAPTQPKSTAGLGFGTSSAQRPKPTKKPAPTTKPPATPITAQATTLATTPPALPKSKPSLPTPNSSSHPVTTLPTVSKTPESAASQLAATTDYAATSSVSNLWAGLENLAKGAAVEDLLNRLDTLLKMVDGVSTKLGRLEEVTANVQSSTTPQHGDPKRMRGAARRVKSTRRNAAPTTAVPPIAAATTTTATSTAAAGTALPQPTNAAAWRTTPSPPAVLPGSSPSTIITAAATPAPATPQTVTATTDTPTPAATHTTTPTTPTSTTAPPKRSHVSELVAAREVELSLSVASNISTTGAAKLKSRVKVLGGKEGSTAAAGAKTQALRAEMQTISKSIKAAKEVVRPPA